LLGQSLAGRPPGGGLLANAKRVRLVCGWRLGAGSRQPLASKINFVYKNGLSASRNQQVKTNGAGCRASREHWLRSAGKKANFGAVKICLFAQRTHKIKRCQGAEIGLKRALLVVK